MKYLRIILFLSAVLCLFGGIFILIKEPHLFFLSIYLFVIAVVFFIGIFFEKGRYKSKNSEKEGWQRTNERFIDHTSGKLMEVYYNPLTGNRSYREVTN